MLKQMTEPLRAGQVLNEAVAALGACGDCALEKVEVLDVKAGEKWSVQYSALILDRASHESANHWLTVHHVPDSRFDRSVARLRRLLGQTGCRLHGSRLFGACSERNLIITPFPLDPKLHRLGRVIQPGEVLKKFKERLPGQLSRAVSVQITPLRYVPGRRCQLLYAFGLEDGSTFELLGKIFRDSRGRRLSRVMNQVADRFDQAAGARIRAARSLDYIPEWQMVVQERVPGNTLYESLRSGSWRESDFRAAAQSLVVLHSQGLELPKSHLVQDELQLIEKAIHRIRRDGFSNTLFEKAFGVVLARAPRLRRASLLPVHRDYYDKQVMVSATQSTMIDLDTMAMGPSEIDVGNFVAHLHLRRLQGVLSPAELVRAERAFLNAYTEGGARLDPRLLGFFRAATFFRLACKYVLVPETAAVVTGLLQLASDWTLHSLANGKSPGGQQ